MSESPPSADDAPLDFSPTDVLTHCPRAQSQDFRCILERQQTVSNRFGSIFSTGLASRSRFVFAVLHFDSLISFSKLSARPSSRAAVQDRWQHGHWSLVRVDLSADSN